MENSSHTLLCWISEKQTKFWFSFKEKEKEKPQSEDFRATSEKETFYNCSIKVTVTVKQNLRLKHRKKLSRNG